MTREAGLSVQECCRSESCSNGPGWHDSILGDRGMIFGTTIPPIVEASSVTFPRVGWDVSLRFSGWNTL